MPEYISKFLEKGIRLLLRNDGQGFLNEYYKYIYKIYNYQIPLKQIATKGKVKKSVEEYIKDCNTVTKAGTKKARQAWMELVVKENMKVDLGDTLYYINTGTKKSDADVKRVSKFFSIEDGKKIDVTKKIEKEYKLSPEKRSTKNNPNGPTIIEWVSEHYPKIVQEDEISLNCVLLPKSIVESENDYFCEDGQEYNVVKYIEMFNKRITPLLVCFKKEIRGRILIDNPKNRPYFTEEESMLCSGQPNKESDQDTYEQLMTMEDKEIRFWMSHPEWDVPFIEECGMDWEQIKADYIERMNKEKEYGIDKVREQFASVIESLTIDELDKFVEEGEVPKGISKICDIDPVTGNFVAKNYKEIVLYTINDIIDYREFRATMEDDGTDEIEEYNENFEF